MKRQKKNQATEPPELPGSGREVFRHGGCEILRLEYSVPEGSDAAARRAAALSAGLLRLIWASGGNLWLLPAAGGLAAACLKELSGWPGPRQGRRLRRSL